MRICNLIAESWCPNHVSTLPLHDTYIQTFSLMHESILDNWHWLCLLRSNRFNKHIFSLSLFQHRKKMNNAIQNCAESGWIIVLPVSCCNWGKHSREIAKAAGPGSGDALWNWSWFLPCCHSSELKKGYAPIKKTTFYHCIISTNTNFLRRFLPPVIALWEF